jgi:hypothetical protein
MTLAQQHCWELKDGKLVPVDDPIEGSDSVDTNIRITGYWAEISCVPDDLAIGAEVVLYQHTSPESGKPRFYLDIMGQNAGIGAIVAKDFGQLVETLNHLAGLFSLIRMDQAANATALTVDALKKR